jgi:hypothetical protein
MWSIIWAEVALAVAPGRRTTSPHETRVLGHAGRRVELVVCTCPAPDDPEPVGPTTAPLERGISRPQPS